MRGCLKCSLRSTSTFVGGCAAAAAAACVRVHMCACVFVHRPRHHATQTFPVLFLNAPLFHIAHLGLGSSWSYFCARDEVDTNFIHEAPTTGCGGTRRTEVPWAPRWGCLEGPEGCLYITRIYLISGCQCTGTPHSGHGWHLWGFFLVSCFLWQYGSGVHMRGQEELDGQPGRELPMR